MPDSLTHLDESGEAAMVDVSAKEVSQRVATASSFIRLRPETLGLINANQIAKGNVLVVAKIAAIQAAKQTQHLIPHCHQIPLSSVKVEFDVRDDGVLTQCTAKTIAQTGVEMEALTGASIAALTIYDMCKAVDPEMEIVETKLLSKTKQPV